MLYFPQLASGAATQFPGRRRRQLRTVGGEWKLADPAGAVMSWELELHGLTDDEWGAIEALFQAAGGRHRNFTFVDPFDNLLAHSGDWTAAVWTPGPLLTVSGELLGNTGQAAARLMQRADAPGWLTYCFSVSARGAAGARARLVLKSGAAEAVEQFELTGEWRRLHIRRQLATEAEYIECGLEVEAGAELEAREPQLEAQPGPSAYKKTAGRGGVYRRARFGSDELQVRTQGPGDHSTRVLIESRMDG